MSVSQAARYRLYEAARASWSEDVAETLMELVPPLGWSDGATKADVEQLRATVATKVEVHQLRAEMHERFADQTRILVLTIVAGNATLVGLVFAALRFG